MPTAIGEARSNGVSTIPSNQEVASKISNKYKTPMRDKPTEVTKNVGTIDIQISRTILINVHILFSQ